MKERENPFEVLNPYLQSENVIEEIRNNIKKKELIELLLKSKSLYEEQLELVKVIEQNLQGLLNTITEPEEPVPEEPKKKESYMNEKIFRKSLDILEKGKKINKEVLAVGEHYKVDIYRLIWKKRYIRQFYILLSKKMKKSGYHDYKLNWDRINKLIKHQGKSIEKSVGPDISTKNLKIIKSLVARTLEKQA
jgi:hypothetical protein